MPGDCPPNEYGSERFVVLVQMPPDYAVGNGLHKSARSLCPSVPTSDHVLEQGKDDVHLGPPAERLCADGTR
jgi:hypothetical protein